MHPGAGSGSGPDLTCLFDLTSLHNSDLDEVIRARSSLIALENSSLESPVSLTLPVPLFWEQ